MSDTKLPEGTLILTEDQTRGRGQMGNKWLTEKGKNLTFSIVLYPSFLRPNQHFYLTQFVSIAIQEVIQELLPDKGIKIKWPNDLYVENRKLAGILIENILSGHRIQSSILGIGLNVNQVQFPTNFKILPH